MKVGPLILASVARDLGATPGPATYPVVGALAFLETGAGAGLIVPGELAVVIGGAAAGIVVAHRRWRVRAGWGRGPIPPRPRRRQAASR